MELASMPPLLSTRYSRSHPGLPCLPKAKRGKEAEGILQIPGLPQE